MLCVFGLFFFFFGQVAFGVVDKISFMQVFRTLI